MPDKIASTMLPTNNVIKSFSRKLLSAVSKDATYSDLVELPKYIK